MLSRVYIGIDLGSTSLKIAAFSGRDGQVLALAGAPIPWRRTNEGVCQVLGSALRGMFEELLAKVVADLGEQSKAVAAISVVGHGGGLYVVDQNGELLDDLAVSSTDQRATQFANRVSEARVMALREEVGSAPWSGQPALIAGDILRKDPSMRNHCASLFFAKDYLAMLLSGQIATDYSDGSTAGLLDVQTRMPSELAFSVAADVAFQQKLLAPLRNSGAQLGELRTEMAVLVGLSAGIPIAVGAIDLFGAMTGVGAVRPGDAAAIFGTWCVNAAIGHKQPSNSSTHHLGTAGVSNVVLLNSTDSMMYMNNSAASMANTTWFAATLQLDALSLLDAAFESVPGANGLSYMPFINGGGQNSAALLGLRAFHTRSDIARAVVEGVTALHAVSLNDLRDTGLDRKRLFALGGGAGDVRLCKLLATMLGEALYTPGADESGARGAAMFAAASIGESPIPLQKVPGHIEPIDKEHIFYRDYLSNFKDMLADMAPVFSRSNKHLQ